MRELVYYVATTIDGFIAREDGSFGDFPWDETFGADLLLRFPETFPARFHDVPLKREENRRFDAVLMGRRTYSVGLEEGVTNPYPTLDQYVFSRTMRSSPDPAVELVSGGATEVVAALKQGAGKGIWLCGGSDLASGLLRANLIDRLVIKLNPVVFGSGIPLFGSSSVLPALTLVDSEIYESGHTVLEYAFGG